MLTRERAGHPDYCRITFCPSWRPLSTSALIPFEIPTWMGTFFHPSFASWSGTSAKVLWLSSYTTAVSGMISTLCFSWIINSALALMFALSSPVGFWIETDFKSCHIILFHAHRRNLSHFAVIGFPGERLHTNAGRLSNIDFSDISLVNLAQHIHRAHISQSEKLGCLRPENKDRTDRVTNLYIP